MDPRLGWEATLATFLAAFALSMVVAWVYVATYQGLSYLRSFAQTLAMAGVVAAMLMLAIGEDVARGLGLVGALTLVRFRTSLKDTRDSMFIAASLAGGVACGVQAYALAVSGTLMFCFTAAVVSWTTFGVRQQFDAVLRLRIKDDGVALPAFSRVMKRRCRAVVLIQLRENEDATQDHAYHVKLARAVDQETLMHELGDIPGVSSPSLLMQDSSLEM